MTSDPRISQFRDAGEDMRHARGLPDTPQGRSPTYRLAYADTDFLLRDEMRGVRLQLELSKAEIDLTERGIDSTVVIFGSARIPEPRKRDSAPSPGLAALADYYGIAREFARAIAERSIASGGRDYVIATGGGPGIMEAGNRGAADAGSDTIGFNIVLPHEQRPNQYVTPELCFNFHYFAVRKMHFLMRARAIAVFPGGFGTLDEMFEAITLIQTGRMKRVPIVIFGAAYWKRIVNFPALVEAGVIAEADLGLLSFVETVDEALAVIDSGL
ncbi:TIGR00730 family Rossman fold protein [Solirhodobacter olei]|uniref:LOG family protein n=1 Tax=Solirhodobacter olei TaxID=2493082 RepID=UPI000FD9C385|nr:TIGR00730 family Rossman fold protein [Solirhodobacter olei]